MTMITIITYIWWVACSKSKAPHDRVFRAHLVDDHGDGDNPDGDDDDDGNEDNGNRWQSDGDHCYS